MPDRTTKVHALTRATIIALAVAALNASLVAPRAAIAQGAPGGISLDSLLNTRISTASKYAQTADEAAASVTIVTSDDIERNGYANLGEVLEGVRGFYLSSDRNYQYLGTRGFSRPSDYNNRILVLVDGHTLNEHTWGSAQVGDDITLDLASIERIEIVRGPGSVLYGTNALFAVINVVTKDAAALDGMTASARVASSGHGQASIAAGRMLGANTTASIAATVSRSSGERGYFPTFDAPATNDGVTELLDRGIGMGATGMLRHRGLTMRAGILSKEKNVPTAAFGNRFNDPRTDRLDRSVWAELSATREFGPTLRASARVYGDRYLYVGNGAYDVDSVFIDRGTSTIYGAETMGVWETNSRNRFTAGAEYRDVLRSHYLERFPDGTTTEDDAPTTVRAVFAQDEFQFSSRVRVVGGVRYEENSRHGGNTVPRFAVILTPTRATTLKALYGEAFRAPSAAEADLATAFYQKNPDMRAERVRTLELAVTHRVSQALLVGGSVYGYHIHDLIDQVEFDEEGRLQYRNTENAHGSGVEMEFDLRPVEALRFRGTYAYQFQAEGTSGERLTNAPAQVAMLASSLVGRGLRSTLTLRHESGRRTFDGSSTKAFVRTDAFVGTTRDVLAGAEVGVRVTNLFDVDYATPVGIEHVAPAMSQPGRRASLQLTWRF